MYRLNLVFHQVKNNPLGEWEVSSTFFEQLYEWCKKQTFDFHFYFDDGKCLDLPNGILRGIARNSTIAIETGNVGKQGYLTWLRLQDLRKMGFSFASHTVSHSALCIYDKSGTKILPMPSGGEYAVSLRGKGQVLSENQVKYQLVESKKKLIETGFSVDEIVFPYGLYSPRIISMLDELGIYSYYVTCDEGIYKGGKMVSRFLVYGDRTLEEHILCLTKHIE